MQILPKYRNTIREHALFILQDKSGDRLDTSKGFNALNSVINRQTGGNMKCSN